MSEATTSQVVARLARYDAALRADYGIDVPAIRRETADGWEHLVASAERDVPPEDAIRRLANVLGLVPSGSLFARTLEEARLYNEYRLALRSYGEENGLPWDSAGQSPVARLDGRSLTWQVFPVRDDRGRIVECRFGLQDPTTGEKFMARDLGDALNMAFEALHQARLGAEARPGQPRG